MAAMESCSSMTEGQMWSKWATYIGFKNSDNDEDDKNNKQGDVKKLETNSMTLRKEDMSLFGFCPAWDEFYLVVCELCNLVVKPQALRNHIELRHGNSLFTKSERTEAAMQHSKGNSKNNTSVSSNSISNKASVGSCGAKSNIPSGHVSPRSHIKLSSHSHGNNSSTSKSTHHGAAPATKSKTEKTKANSKLKKNHSMAPVVRVERMSPSLVKTASTVNSPGADKKELPSPQQPPPPSLVDETNILASSTSGPGPGVNSALGQLLTSSTSASASSSPRANCSAKNNSTTLNGNKMEDTQPVGKKSNSKSRKVPKERKILPCKDREYDPNKHCGVQVADTVKPCTHSLTCKTHSLSLRRSVVGRQKSFDELLADHRAAKEAAVKAAKAAAAAVSAASLPHSVSKNESQQSVAQMHELPVGALATNSTSSKSSPGSNKFNSSNSSQSKSSVLKSTKASLNKSASTQGIPFHRQSSNVDATKSESIMNESLSLISSQVDQEFKKVLPDPSYITQHPKPAALCTFGLRQLGNGLFMLDRRWDLPRAAFRSAVCTDRSSHPPPLKKLCVESRLPPVPEPLDPSDPYSFTCADTMSSGNILCRSGASSITGISKHTGNPLDFVFAHPVSKSIPRIESATAIATSVTTIAATLNTATSTTSATINSSKSDSANSIFVATTSAAISSSTISTTIASTTTSTTTVTTTTTVATTCTTSSTSTTSTPSRTASHTRKTSQSKSSANKGKAKEKLPNTSQHTSSKSKSSGNKKKRATSSTVNNSFESTTLTSSLPSKGTVTLSAVPSPHPLPLSFPLTIGEHLGALSRLQMSSPLMTNRNNLALSSAIIRNQGMTLSGTPPPPPHLGNKESSVMLAGLDMLNGQLPATNALLHSVTVSRPIFATSHGGLGIALGATGLVGKMQHLSKKSNFMDGDIVNSSILHSASSNKSANMVSSLPCANNSHILATAIAAGSGSVWNSAKSKAKVRKNSSTKSGAITANSANHVSSPNIENSLGNMHGTVLSSSSNSNSANHTSPPMLPSPSTTPSPHLCSDTSSPQVPVSSPLPNGLGPSPPSFFTPKGMSMTGNLGGNHAFSVSPASRTSTPSPVTDLSSPGSTGSGPKGKSSNRHSSLSKSSPSGHNTFHLSMQPPLNFSTVPVTGNPMSSSSRSATAQQITYQQVFASQMLTSAQIGQIHLQAAAPTGKHSGQSLPTAPGLTLATAALPLKLPLLTAPGMTSPVSSGSQQQHPLLMKTEDSRRTAVQLQGSSTLPT